MASRLHVIGAAALIAAAASCEQSSETSIPTFADGGLLRTGKPLSRQQFFLFEGMFGVAEGGDLLGAEVAVRTSRDTVSLLTDKKSGFSPLGAACLPDRRVVLEGYWQYPAGTDAGLVRVFVEPPEIAGALCDGAAPAPTTALRLTGSYGDGDDQPSKALTLTWSRELKPWRGRFFTVAHRGGCEVADHCGVTPNSVEALRLAERSGANAAEIDVRLTSDGIPILFHDPMLSASVVKGLFCNGQIADYSLAELRGSCVLKYGEAIPTLQETLDALIANTELEAVYLDMKTPDAILPTARIAARTIASLHDRALAIFVGLPDQDILDAWRAAKPVLQAEGLAIPPCLLEFDPDLVISEGCTVWSPTWTEGPQVGKVRALQSAGARVLFWTMNQSDFIDAYLTQAQPNGLVTGRQALVFHEYQTIGTPPSLPPPPAEAQPVGGSP